MKYLSLLKKYIVVFVGAVLFGVAAVKLKSAERGRNKANDRVREYMDADITIKDAEVDAHVSNLNKKQDKAAKAKRKALEKLDTIAKNSSSVGSLLDEYNSNRV